MRARILVFPSRGKRATAQPRQSTRTNFLDVRPTTVEAMAIDDAAAKLGEAEIAAKADRAQAALKKAVRGRGIPRARTLVREAWIACDELRKVRERAAFIAGATMEPFDITQSEFYPILENFRCATTDLDLGDGA